MSKWLLLIPTDFEKKQIQAGLEHLQADLANSNSLDLVVETCGFGPIVSAARTSQLLVKHNPSQVLLIGIAGSLQDLESGKAYRFSSVACHGVGVGEGEQFQTAEQMGWSQSVDGAPVENPIQLNVDGVERQLLTVCAASDDSAKVSNRLTHFPNAVAEDMEGYAVALACQLFGVNLEIVRGISNSAGVRDKSKWQVESAMVAALKLGRQIIQEADNESV